ncbi:MAG: PspA/IM30 family protein [Paracoccaceae bacterium]
MISTFKSLFAGSSARAEEKVRDIYSIELIDQKIREGSAGLRAAKAALAGLIQRERSEVRQIKVIEKRVQDLISRATEALAAKRDDLANEAAQAIAHMENELTLRHETVSRLQARVIRLRQSVETTNRRIVDLKQGAVSARAIRQEQGIQARLNTTLAGDSPLSEAEGLIADVMGRDDPFEQGEILREIENGLSSADLGDRLAAQGFGPATKVTAAEVLGRLKTTK